ncbi:hypothetical protein BWK59_04230 [Flavobacterium davisii]|uniref:Uncharacterized protein n=1 Tax=Flavobacterium davisii TaxID=2906077 RepID=A0A246GK23_9FLAO|nr:hypothetical protein BWK59_04230 [Flavobacterium davisii]
MLLIPLGGVGIKGLINQISGRIAMFKKELKIEQKRNELCLSKISFKRCFFYKCFKNSQQLFK